MLMRIFRISRKYKQIITKVIPINYLRKWKRRFFDYKLSKIKSVEKKNIYFNKYSSGINLIANIKGDFGLGQSSRILAYIIMEANIPISIYNYTHSDNINMNDTTFDSLISNELPYNINLIHINPSEFEEAYLKLDKGIWKDRYNIAFWLWELEIFPTKFLKTVPLFQEIWTPSEFIKSAIEKAVNLPVRKLPYFIKPSVKNYDRLHYRLPNKQFLFLIMYDSNSVMERKNPVGAIEAFKKAFSYNEEVALVVKINSSDVEEVNRLKKLLEGYSYYIIDFNMSKSEVDCLIGCVDVLISLHRAEGFGLVMAEAMALKTAVIATNWSANTEYMNKENSCLVNYKLIKIEEDIGPYERGNYWADADINQTAEYMKKLYYDQEFKYHMENKAFNDITKKLSLEKSVCQLKEYYKEIVEFYE